MKGPCALRIKMHAITQRPKLFPPLALLRQAPAPSPTLTRQELRRIVADLIG